MRGLIQSDKRGGSWQELKIAIIEVVHLTFSNDLFLQDKPEAICYEDQTCLPLRKITGAALAGSVALVGILMLLVQKELASAAKGGCFPSLSKALNMGIAPMPKAFAVVVVSQGVEMLCYDLAFNK